MKAIERLKHFEPPEGYYLAFSGGKDSIVIKTLADMAGVKYDAHYSVTTIDPPELVRFIIEQHSDVIMKRPEKPFLRMIPVKGFPQRHRRWCCALYKENGGDNRRVITGIRWAESYNRSKRKMFEHCMNGGYKSKNKTFVNPIIDWDNRQVWQFINDNNLPYPSLYDEGWDRVGCLFCPMAYWKQRYKHAQRYPKIAYLFIKAFEQLWDKHKYERWPNGEAMFWDWIDEKGILKAQDKQLMLFE